LKPIALTMGEPSGIGGEIALKAWAESCRRGPAFFVVDDPQRLARLARHVGLNVAVQVVGTPDEAEACFASALPVLPLPRAVEAAPGRPHGANAGAVLESIDRAVALARSGAAAAVVTNPISKAVLYRAGFQHAGHTEYLAAAAGGSRPVMMLAVPGLRVVLVTVHVPLAAVSGLLSTDAIVEVARIADASLRRDFAITRPRLVIAALNPHAGEEGSMGSEDRDIIAPAVCRLQAIGIKAEGPLPADTMFHLRARAGYDAAICMYHDQALIPVKTIDFDRGVNVTLGLPFVRTSPDHGTALDIAGTGNARPDSLLAALQLARSMAENRARHLAMADQQ
jgi:4-hydroxythreonine-4-phosphate dehydrogenase